MHIVGGDAELLFQGIHQLDTVAEFQMLLKTQFEGPVYESRARFGLIHLSQKKKGETHHYVHGFDRKFAP